MKKINYVNEIDEDFLKLEVNDKSLVDKLKQVGGSKKLMSNDWIITFSDKSEQLILIGKLIEFGVAFEGGIHGWPPSEQLVQLRNDGHLTGTWKEVVWKSKSESVIRDK